MKYSASKAAEAVGKSTATITRAIEKGKLSAVKDTNGAWEIDAAELHRVFPPKSSENPSMQSDEKPRNADALHVELQLMGEKLRSASALNDRLADEVSDLRQRLDDAAARSDRDAEERRKLTAILTDQRAQPMPSEIPAPLPVIETPPPASETGLLGRLWNALRGG